MDGPASEKLEDPEFIARRIGQVNLQTCRPELEANLPAEIYEQLAKLDFEPLRAALKDLFSDWL